MRSAEEMIDIYETRDREGGEERKGGDGQQVGTQ